MASSDTVNIMSLRSSARRGPPKHYREPPPPRHVAPRRASPSVGRSRQFGGSARAAPARRPGAWMSRRPDTEARPLYRYSARARRGPSNSTRFFAQRGLEGVAAAARVYQHLNAGRGLVRCFKCLGSRRRRQPRVRILQIQLHEPRQRGAREALVRASPFRGRRCGRNPRRWTRPRLVRGPRLEKTSAVVQGPRRGALEACLSQAGGRIKTTETPLSERRPNFAAIIRRLNNDGSCAE